ncbi:MAG: sn-glycerol-3-phosphate ABC transporter ATP-binding protein UgpC [Chloroflexi bacterium]|nr:sn-glycerol-3-phosphate ABC transporter ATP-binding protein UgpC [Chloroflexota bacterium]
MARVIFEQVSKFFGDVVALRDLDLEVHDREFIVLVGPSGSGKSTALRLVAGLEEATTGRIYIGNRVVNDLAPKDRDVAMVFQSYALYPHMNAYDNMAHPLRLRRLPRGEVDERVRRTAEMLGIAELLQRKPRELSGGQRQRVALGRALVRDPAVFLMDEPLSNLDVKLRVATRAELIRLHERLRTTTIYVTHDQQEAMTLGDRIAVLNNGILQQLGAPEVLYNRPGNLFVAGFIGNPAMSFFDVQIIAEGEAVFVEGIGVKLQLPPHVARPIERRIGEEIVLGIRPEHLFEPHDVEHAPPDSTVEATVDLVEPMGAEVYVHLVIARQHFTARLGPDCELRRGQRTTLVVDTRKLHLFDKRTQRSLLY